MICATDLAEVIGTKPSVFNLLFGILLEIGVLITALDVFLILWLQNLGFRWIEALIVMLLGVSVCFAVQIALADPDWRGWPGCAHYVDIAAIPTAPTRAGIGATVMPHNPSSALCDRRRRLLGRAFPKSAKPKFATIDSTLALMFALLINASILIPAAATFYKPGVQSRGAGRGAFERHT